jgi:hypothetical protein
MCAARRAYGRLQRRRPPAPCKVAAGVQHPIDLGPIFGPLLDLVEIAVIRNQRIVGLFG